MSVSGSGDDSGCRHDASWWPRLWMNRLRCSCRFMASSWDYAGPRLILTRLATAWKVPSRYAKLKLRLDRFEQLEAQRAVVAFERNDETHRPVLGAAEIARKRTDAFEGASLVGR